MERAHAEGLPKQDFPPIVLVVDDHDDILDLFDSHLTHHGYWVARASTGLEALECAHDLQPDVVVTDVGLAGDMDGLDLIRQLRTDERLNRIPVLVVTGRSPGDLPSFAGLPVSGLLLKPVAPETLVSRLAELLRPPGRGTPVEQVTATEQPRLTAALPAHAPARGTVKGVDKKQRQCPRCGMQLLWVETRRWIGIEFDYYRWCENGCGLYCFNRNSEAFETLIQP